MGFAQIAGLKIYYHAVSDPKAKKGQRVIYIHGTGCNTKVWVKHMEALAKFHTPVAIDLPGHGQSDGCGFRGVGDYSRFVAELAKSLGWDRFVVAGHSLGGAIALANAVYDAEMVCGLMLIDTGARLRVHPDILNAALQAAREGRPAVTDRTWTFAKTTPQAIMDEVAAMTAGTDPWVTYGDWICDDSFDFSTRLKGIDIPAIAICGQEDRMTPIKYHEFFRDKMPRCELAVIHNASHWVYREQPEEFNRVVKGFLDALPVA